MKKLSIVLALSCVSFFSYGEKIKLVIDAAHGGQDAGAVSVSGDKESDLSMQFAQALADYAKTKNIEVVLTRSSNNENVTLDKRTNFKVEGGVKTYFISFHADASNDRNERGGSVMYSSQNVNADASKALAEKMVAKLNMLNDIGTRLEDKKGVMVLRNSPAPAIGIQVGYISNSMDLTKLKDAGTQKELAALIVKAVTE
jgi:N-acetylmuramoyl-L-alanine amidase